MKPTFDVIEVEPPPTLVRVPSFTSEPPPLEFRLKLPLPLSNSRRAPLALRSIPPLFRLTAPLVLKIRLPPLALVWTSVRAFRNCVLPPVICSGPLTVSVPLPSMVPAVQS